MKIKWTRQWSGLYESRYAVIWREKKLWRIKSRDISGPYAADLYNLRCGLLSDAKQAVAAAVERDLRQRLAL